MVSMNLLLTAIKLNSYMIISEYKGFLFFHVLTFFLFYFEMPVYILHSASVTVQSTEI